MNEKLFTRYIYAMAFLAFIYCFWLFWRMFLPMEIDANEGWNALHISRYIKTGQLYPISGTLLINNYPPLTFILISWLHTLTAIDAIFLGRCLSILATFLISFHIYQSVLIFNGTKKSAIFASLWFLATMGRFFWGYMGMNDPSLLALSIMTFAFILFMKAYLSSRSLYFSLFMMVIAGFFKHNHIVIPLACVIFIYTRNIKEGMKYSIYSAILCLFGLFICYIIYGNDFFHNFMMPRLVELRLSLINLGRLQWVLPALMISLIWIFTDLKNKTTKYFAILIAIAFISNFLQKMGEGVGNNAQFELVFVVAIALGLTLTHFSKIMNMKAISWIFIVLTLRLLLSTRNEPYLFFTPQFHQQYTALSQLAHSEIERVKKIDGKLACSIKSICYYAGKDFYYDNFYIHELIRTHKMQQTAIDNLIDKEKIQFITINEQARWLIR